MGIASGTIFATVLTSGFLIAGGTQAETITVAVAANFTEVAEQLAPLFAAETGHAVAYSFGATGQLYAQISQGAPYVALLAADADRPALAIEAGYGVAGSAFTYAIGALALYSATVDVHDGAAVLAGSAFEKLAVADPNVAPYGRAALQTLAALGLSEGLGGKLVTGQNITQTLQFVETGNAELGLVALSQVAGRARVWVVPDALYDPIAQDAVLLKFGQDSVAARAFLAFLRSETATTVIEAAGYRR